MRCANCDNLMNDEGATMIASKVFCLGCAMTIEGQPRRWVYIVYPYVVDMSHNSALERIREFDALKGDANEQGPHQGLPVRSQEPS